MGGAGARGLRGGRGVRQPPEAGTHRLARTALCNRSAWAWIRLARPTRSAPAAGGARAGGSGPHPPDRRGCATTRRSPPLLDPRGCATTRRSPTCSIQVRTSAVPGRSPLRIDVLRRLCEGPHLVDTPSRGTRATWTTWRRRPVLPDRPGHPPRPSDRMCRLCHVYHLVWAALRVLGPGVRPRVRPRKRMHRRRARNRDRPRARIREGRRHREATKSNAVRAGARAR
jgi:hypothetical protein